MQIERVEAGSGLVGDVAALMGMYRVFYGRDGDGEVERCREFLEARLGRGESVVFAAVVDVGAGAAEARAEPGAERVDDPARRAVGFTQLYPSSTTVGLARVWILNDLFVHPEFRRGGVAGALMERAEAFARETGAARIELQTAKTNAAARALYEARGWGVDGVFDRYVLRL